MALNSKDKGKLLRSIARWLAGLRPVFGKKHYFEKYSTARCVMKKLSAFRGLRVCPFCGKVFNRASTLVSHILRYHSKDIEDLIERCEMESGSV